MPALKTAILAMLVVVLSGIAVTGCNDGKLNLLLVFRTDRDEDDPSDWPELQKTDPSSSAALSSAAAPSSSSAPVLSSSSAISQSSGDRATRPPRPDGPKTSKDGTEYVDYPTLEEGIGGAKRGWASRYWDACKPHCSLPKSVANTNPWGICRNCDKNSNEMPAYFMHPEYNPPWYYGEWLPTPSVCAPGDQEPNYSIWQTNEKVDYGSAYACMDMTPHIVNDTLAYAFAATPGTDDTCGKCFVLQFDGESEPNTNFGQGRQSHKALKGKNLVVMSSNIGHDVGSGQFDIMIPGGGEGAFPTYFTAQIGVPEGSMGPNFGGILSACIQSSGDAWKVATMEFLQNCVREKCNNVFGNNAKHKVLLDGCMFMADWYMAADNPTHIYKEVECPQYLRDKYRSTIHTEKPVIENPWN